MTDTPIFPAATCPGDPPATWRPAPNATHSGTTDELHRLKARELDNKIERHLDGRDDDLRSILQAIWRRLDAIESKIGERGR